jgi:hypothetical protein
MLPQIEDDRTVSQVDGSTVEVKVNILQRGRWEEFQNLGGLSVLTLPGKTYRFICVKEVVLILKIEDTDNLKERIDIECDASDNDLSLLPGYWCFFFWAYSLTLKVKEPCSSDISDFYQTVQCYLLEDCTLIYLHICLLALMC